MSRPVPNSFLQPDRDGRWSRLGNWLTGLVRGLVLILWLWVAARLLIGATEDGGEAGLVLMAVPCLACLGLLMAPGAAPEAGLAKAYRARRRRTSRIVADLRPALMRPEIVVAAPRRAPRIVRATGLAAIMVGRTHPRRASRIVQAPTANGLDRTALSA